MINKIPRTRDHISLVLGAAFLGALALPGCAKQEASQPAAAASAPPALQAPAPVVVQDQPVVVQGQPDVAMEDDYVYYPQYEVYYSPRRHLYGYRDGNAWAWRPAPEHIGVNVLLGSPSVHMDFHDSPERHHEAIVRSYPKNWRPPGERDDRKH
jgi:hypothetical protein